MQCHKFYWIVPGRFGVGCIREERNFKVRHGTANAGMERILVSRKANKKSSSMPRFPHGEQVPLFAIEIITSLFHLPLIFALYQNKESIVDSFYLKRNKERKEEKRSKRRLWRIYKISWIHLMMILCKNHLMMILCKKLHHSSILFSWVLNSTSG